MAEPNIRINPLNDLLFKKMLATEDKKTILQGFIRDFFDINAALDEIILVTPYSIKSYMEYTQITDNNETINQDDNPVPVHVMRETLRDITVVVKTADLLIELQIYNDKYFIIRSGGG